MVVSESQNDKKPAPGGERAKAKGERRGGTVRFRTTRGGGQVDRYKASCDGCGAEGPEATGARAARALATRAGWLCEKKRVGSGFGQSNAVKVRCPACCAGSTPDPA